MTLPPMSLQERLRNASLVHPVIPEAAAELDRLQARVSELEVDAERYRWLRDRACPFDVWTDDPDGLILAAEDLDAAIDTARKAKP